jgi:hypothetical protein
LSKSDEYSVVRAFTEKTASSTKSFRLNVDTGSSLSEVFVIDGGFNLVARGQGTLQARLPKGEYLLKYRAGDRLEENWIQLDRDQYVKPPESVLPPNVVPISERVGWSQEESLSAEDLRSTCTLSVVIRDPNGSPPADDVRILDRDGEIVAKLVEPSGSGWKRKTQGQVIGMGGKISPGGYMIQVSTPGLRPYAMPLWVAPQCATQVFMERKQLSTWGKSRKGPHLASASIFVAAQYLSWPDLKRFLSLAETAKSVLSYDRPIVPSDDEIHESLDEKFRCPILGLLAAHLLRLRYEESSAKQDEGAGTARSLMEVAVGNLEKLMPGSPDVGALQFALGRPGTGDFGVPPMLAHSWAILQELGQSAIPAGSYAERIRPAVCATRPWLVFNKSKMEPRTTGKSVRKRSGKLSALSPAVQEAARELGGRIAVDVDGERIVLRRK